MTSMKRRKMLISASEFRTKYPHVIRANRRAFEFRNAERIRACKAERDGTVRTRFATYNGGARIGRWHGTRGM